MLQEQEGEPGQRKITVTVTPNGTVTRVENEAGTWSDSQSGMGAGRALSRVLRFRAKNSGYTLDIVNRQDAS